MKRNIFGKNNPNYGNHPVFSESWKKKQSIINSGKGNPAYKHGKTLVEAFCIDCNKKLGKNAFFYGHKRCGSCACKKKYENINYKLNVISKCLTKRPNSPNKKEIKIIALLPKIYKFVGNGKFFVENFNPDFVYEKEKKIVEFYGSYWHRDKKRDLLRIKAYTKAGYKTLVIWDYELKEIDKLKIKIYEFVRKN